MRNFRDCGIARAVFPFYRTGKRGYRMRHIKTPAKGVCDLRFSPDGRCLYLLSEEPNITPDGIDVVLRRACRIDVGSGEITGDWSFKASDIAVFTPDLRLIYHWPSSEPYSDETDSHYLHLLDLDSGNVKRVFGCDDFEEGFGSATGCALSPDGQVLALVEYQRSNNAIRRLHLPTMTELEPIPEDTIWVAYSCDSRWLASGGYANRGVRAWVGTDLGGEWSEPAAGGLGWSTDGRLAWGAEDRLAVVRPGVTDSFQIWNVSGSGTIVGLAFAPDGRLVLVGRYGGTCALHDTIVGHEIAAFDWGIGPIHSVAFAPDGLTCAAGGEKGQVVVWDVDN